MEIQYGQKIIKVHLIGRRNRQFEHIHPMMDVQYDHYPNCLQFQKWKLVSGP